LIITTHCDVIDVVHNEIMQEELMTLCKEIKNENMIIVVDFKIDYKDIDE
jgi:hypothetical protein